MNNDFCSLVKRLVNNSQLWLHLSAIHHSIHFPWCTFKHWSYILIILQLAIQSILSLHVQTYAAEDDLKATGWFLPVHKLLTYSRIYPFTQLDLGWGLLFNSIHQSGHSHLFRFCQISVRSFLSLSGLAGVVLLETHFKCKFWKNEKVHFTHRNKYMSHWNSSSFLNPLVHQKCLHLSVLWWKD